MTHGAGATVWRFTPLSLEEPFYRMKDSELCGYKVRGLAEDSFDAKYRCFPFLVAGKTRKWVPIPSAGARYTLS